MLRFWTKNWAVNWTVGRAVDWAVRHGASHDAAIPPEDTVDVQLCDEWFAHIHFLDFFHRLIESMVLVVKADCEHQPLL